MDYDLPAQAINLPAFLQTFCSESSREVEQVCV